MDYYRQVQFLAAVDEDDRITGQIEKWRAHKKGILHRGYTAILEHKGVLLLQHRRHPVFDDVYDLSFSSHQVYVDGLLQTDTEAIMTGLGREWGVKREDLEGEMKFLRKIYYKAIDEKSGYTEHEMDYIYLVPLKRTPVADRQFAYGQLEIKRSDLASRLPELGKSLAPWVGAFMKEHLL